VLSCTNTSLLAKMLRRSRTRTYGLLVVNVTGSNKAESSLLLRLALFIVIGDPDWDAHTASDRASAPRRALSDTTLGLRYHSSMHTRTDQHSHTVTLTAHNSHWCCLDNSYWQPVSSVWSLWLRTTCRFSHTKFP